jgi:(1->4)-alpha-D-glucan 1-alpha-D-glucosylmutase
VVASQRHSVRGQLAYAQAVVEGWPDGRIKLLVTQRTLHLRRTQRALFTGGGYLPLEATGTGAQHLCAYARTANSSQNSTGQASHALVVVPRLVATLTGRIERAPLGEAVWGDTLLLLPAAVGAHPLTNLFTGETLTPIPHGQGWAVRVAEVLGHFPVALLTAG